MHALLIAVAAWLAACALAAVAWSWTAHHVKKGGGRRG
jgi:hypothetical protein